MNAPLIMPVGSGRNRAQLYALFALIVYTPLPLASDRPWALVLLGLLTGILFLWNMWRPSGRSAGAVWQYAKIPLVLLGLWMALLAIQLVPIVWSAVLDSRVSNVFSSGTISIDPYSTRLYLAQACILSAIFWLVIAQVNSRRRMELLVKVIVFSGLLQALVGVVVMSTGTTFQLFFVPLLDARAHGTFVSPNNFAGYLELTLAVGIGLMIAKLDGRQAANWKRRLHGWVALIISEKAMLRLSLIIMVVGLVASRSRMGNSAFFASLLIVGLFTVIIAKYMARNVREKHATDATRSMIFFITSLIVLDVFIIGGVVGVEKVVERIEYTNLQTQVSEVQAGDVQEVVVQESKRAESKVQNNVKALILPKHREEESVEQRSKAARSAVQIIYDFPWSGTGGGTFHLSFLHYQPWDVQGFFDHAHNDYVEFASDVGLPGILLLGLMVLHSIVRSISLLVKSGDQMARGMAFASLMGVISLLIHGAVDFNFQNPANAMLFLIVLSFPYLLIKHKQA